MSQLVDWKKRRLKPWNILQIAYSENSKKWEVFFKGKPAGLSFTTQSDAESAITWCLNRIKLSCKGGD